MSTSSFLTRNDLINVINEIFPATSEDMTDAQVEAFINSVEYNLQNQVDYIVEQGTSGVWTYRKWNSGIAECWGKYSKSIAANSADASNYMSFPFTFSAVPVINITVSAGGADLYRGHIEGGSTNTSQVRITLINKHTAAVVITAHVYVVGRWK